ncbi:DUF3987 domain-containing protein [Flavobacterium agrisoli]|uniref:DUF3987 domain-containing protein n=1 Tax=Flavobacterium agrisoli TaxID=2793066 RepID=A0A934PLI7_9FLAO|nr:DUF3987 domain-containing protein [Flavobacterium agrisoli]MBK0369802.1 DUF3987 domain-containing protein [Flavobacterium agrisoli]
MIEKIKKLEVVVNSSLDGNLYVNENIYEKLPPLLKGLVDCFEGREKDVILLSSVGVLSACLPNVIGVYNKRTVCANLYTFIIAPPASGKGVMNWSQKLIEPIHEAVVAASKLKIAETRSQNRGTNFDLPKLELKVIPGNTSSSKIHSHLQNSSESSLIFESEADSLSKMLKNEYGDFSDLLRKAFHHETVSISRQLDDRYDSIKNPKLSIVLSGTPDQVQPLVNSKGNGLFSRFLYYNFNDYQGWQDVSPKAQAINYDDLFDDAGRVVKLIYDKLKGLERVDVKLTELQWDSFQERMSRADQIIRDTRKIDFTSVVRRMGLIGFRIIMILTILRKYEQIDETTAEVYADDLDVELTIELVKILFDHSLKVFDMFNSKTISLTMAERGLLLRLPENFRRAAGLKIALNFGFATRTFDDLLKKWESKKVICKVSQGNYRKIVLN